MRIFQNVKNTGITRSDHGLPLGAKEHSEPSGASITWQLIGPLPGRAPSVKAASVTLGSRVFEHGPCVLPGQEKDLKTIRQTDIFQLKNVKCVKLQNGPVLILDERASEKQILMS